MLIIPQYVLTAAHCIAWGKGALKLRLSLGDHHLNKKGEAASVTRKVRRIKMHAGYNTTTTDYDIALIEMDKPVEFKENIRPVCLPGKKGKKSSYVGMDAVVTGWGHTRWNGEGSFVLREVTVKVMSESACRRRYGKSSVTPRMLCAGYAKGGRDACQGDSGGPLVLKVLDPEQAQLLLT